eukprot:TCONS_00012033-protein
MRNPPLLFMLLTVSQLFKYGQSSQQEYEIFSNFTHEAECTDGSPGSTFTSITECIGHCQLKGKTHVLMTEDKTCHCTNEDCSLSNSQEKNNGTKIAGSTFYKNLKMKMKLNKNPTCYSAVDPNKFASAVLPKAGRLKYIKLVHVSGMASCRSTEYVNSRWGCDPVIPADSYTSFTIITDADKNNIYPPGPKYWKYLMSPEFDEFADEFVFQPDTPYPVLENQEIRVYHSEPHFDETNNGNNIGDHCIDILVEYE